MDEKEKEVTPEETVSENTDTQASDTPDEAIEESVNQDDSSSEKDEEVVEEKEETVTEENAKEEPKEDEEADKEDEETEETNPKEATVEEATNVLKDKGFDYAELQKEFNETGNISQETREKLAKVGITDEILDNYIDGQKAKVERELDDISSCIGGREKMNEVIKWASENISDEEKISISKVTDANILKVILKDLKGRMEDKEGIVPETQLNGDGGKPQVELYESQAQMFEAIRDPRYKNDEAYRAKVMKKIQASREAGIDLGI